MSRQARLYIAAVTLAGTGALLAACLAVATDPQAFALLLALAVIAGMVEVWGVGLYGDSRVSVSFTIVASAAVLNGFAGAAIVAFGAAVGTLFHNRDRVKFAFNAGVLVLAGASMGAALQAIEVVFDGHGVFVVIGLVVVACVDFLVNSTLVAGVIALTSGRSPWAVWKEKHRWLFLHYLALGLIGLGLAEGFLLAGPLGLAIFLLPAIMQRVSLEQYVRRTERDVAELHATHQNLARSHADLVVAHADLTDLTRRLEQTYDGTLLALVRALDARDTDTRGHSERVASHTRSLAEYMGITPGSDQWETIYRGALLHDVGKIGVVDAVLLKPGKLTPNEQDLMRKHPEIGFEMLKEIPFLKGAAEIVLTHHEQWDGKGYPAGLRREELPLGSRLFSVTDAFDAMMSDRPYRKALSLAQTLDEILRFKGTQFDPAAVEALLDLYEGWLSEYPWHPDSIRSRAA